MRRVNNDPETSIMVSRRTLDGASRWRRVPGGKTSRWQTMAADFAEASKAGFDWKARGFMPPPNLMGVDMMAALSDDIAWWNMPTGCLEDDMADFMATAHICLAYRHGTVGFPGDTMISTQIVTIGDPRCMTIVPANVALKADALCVWVDGKYATMVQVAILGQHPVQKADEDTWARQAFLAEYGDDDDDDDDDDD